MHLFPGRSSGSERGHLGIMGWTAIAGIGFTSLYGASELFGFDLPLLGAVTPHVSSEAHINVPKPKVLTITAEEKLCFADVEVGVSPQMTVDSTIGWGPLSYTAEVLNMTIDATGDTELCADVGDIEWTVTQDPTNPALNRADITARLHSNRPRVTDYQKRGGLEGPWQAPGVPAPDEVKAAKTLEKIAADEINAITCESDVAGTATQSGTKFFLDVSGKYGVPAQNVHENISVDGNNANLSPQEQSQNALPGIAGPLPDGVTISVAGASCGSTEEKPSDNSLNVESNTVLTPAPDPNQRTQGTTR